MLIFVNKSWTIDPRIGCNSPTNLMKLIETNLDLEEKLEKFEGAFEQDEVVNM
jgi:hypothetical protein